MEEDEEDGKKLEKAFMREFGYSYKYLDSLYDTLDQTHKTVKYYMEHTFGSDEDRQELAKLSLEADAVRLQIHELWCASDKLLQEVKKTVYLKQKQKLKADKRQAEEIRAKIRKAEDKVEEIVRKARQHVEKLIK